MLHTKVYACVYNALPQPRSSRCKARLGRLTSNRDRDTDTQSDLVYYTSVFLFVDTLPHENAMHQTAAYTDVGVGAEKQVSSAPVAASLSPSAEQSPVTLTPQPMTAAATVQRGAGAKAMSSNTGRDAYPSAYPASHNTMEPCGCMLQQASVSTTQLSVAADDTAHPMKFSHSTMEPCSCLLQSKL